MSDSQHLFALINLPLCLAIVVICGCRIDIMSRRTKLHVRLTYSILFTAAICSALQPLFWREWPGVAELLMNAALLLLLFSGRKLWPRAVPAPYCHDEDEFGEEAGQVYAVGRSGDT